MYKCIIGNKEMLTQEEFISQLSKSGMIQILSTQELRSRLRPVVANVSSRISTYPLPKLILNISKTY